MSVVPVLPVPTSDVDLFIVRHGRKMAAFFFSLVTVALLAVVAMWIVALVPEALGEDVKEITKAAITACTTLASIFILGNASGDFAHRTPAGEQPKSRQSGVFPAQGG